MPYTALVLDEKSHTALLERVENSIPNGWKLFAHHMTINMGGANVSPAKDMIGKTKTLRVVSLAANGLVFAAGVESEVPSNNKQKHVTIAVNVNAGGKPVMSNDLKDWLPVEPPLELTGTVSVVN